MAEKGEVKELAVLKSIDIRELQDEGKTMLARLAEDLEKVSIRRSSGYSTYE